MTTLARPFCADVRERRAAVADHPTANGIDYLEVVPDDHTRLTVVFLKPLPAGSYGIEADPTTLVRIEGGTRVVGIRVTGAVRNADGALEVQVDRGGDFSTYTLVIDDAVTILDPAFRAIEFSFMAACPVDLDCAPVDRCPPELLVEPEIDYLAKDYDGFRRLLLERLAVLAPDLAADSPADLLVTIIELLALRADHLSYFQDTVALERTLATAVRRVSARRHARLVDYRMHDGRNAWTWIHVAALPGGAAVLPAGAGVLSRVVSPLAGEDVAPGPTIDPLRITPDALAADPALRNAVVFETAHAVTLSDRNNAISIHAWGDSECCLAAGSTELFLFTRTGGTTERPVLETGDFLLLEEVRGTRTGAAGDADPLHRQVVRIGQADDTDDPLYRKVLGPDGELQRRTTTGQAALPLLRIRLDRDQALAFSLCLSTDTPDHGALDGISVARGNMALADHGLLVTETRTPADLVPGGRFPRLALGQGPLTFQAQPREVTRDPLTAWPTSERRDLSASPRAVVPAVAVMADLETGRPVAFEPQPDLLGATEFDAWMVAEVEDDLTWLRFGNDATGRGVDDVHEFHVTYRVGNGPVGNVGREALAHLLLAAGDPAGTLVDAVRNPLPASGGVTPETVEEVRRRAPEAFRATTRRAVTEADYAGFARLVPGVLDAVAAFRWTGSWYTVFVGVEPADPADVVREPGGRARLAPALARQVGAALDGVRMTGYDLELRGPVYVALELAVHACALPGYFRQDVGAAVTDALSARVFGDGTRGFFAPGAFRFGQPVYLSRIYDAVEHVEGVDSAEVLVVRRYGRPDNGELAAGVLAIGPWEVAQLANDPSFAERGVLTVTVGGGTA